MPRLPRTPEQAHSLFAEYFNAGDLDGLLALYEPDAVIIPAPGGQPTRGRQALRNALAGFLALKPQLTLETVLAIQNGDIALLSCHWRVTGTAPDGEAVDMTHNSAEVVRRGPDGVWRYVIDHPYGAD
jgi:uncharacterized protein (TIGR02246 family)